jgi:Leucine-rich repeat (LRR) protein
LSGRSVGTTVSNTTGGNSIGGGANNNNNDASNTSNNHKRHKINLLLDQCETVRFPFKKKLMLNSLNLTAADIPVKDLYGTSLGNSLHKLSMAGNRLSTIPPRLVTCLPVLKTLDLSQCELHQLPERWNLPQLKRLNLSHNRLTDFPEEVSFSVDETTNETTFWFSSFSLSIRSFSIVFPDHVGRSLGIARTQHVRK